MPRRRPPTRHDPTLGRLAPLWSGGRRVRALAVAALAAAVGYLAWRLAATFHGAALWLAIPLFLAEIAGFLQLAALAVQAWRVPRPEPAAAGAPEEGAADVLIVAPPDADPALVERSLVGAASVRGGGRAVVAGPGEAGAALAGMSADAVLVLSAGEVPPPDALVGATRALDDPGVVAVGLPVDFINEDGLAHLFSGRSERELANRVIGPSLGMRGLAPVGTSAFVARRAPLAEAVASGDLPAAPRLGAELLARGRCAFADGASVRTEGPDALGAYLEGAERRAADSLRGLPAALAAVGSDARARIALIAGSARHAAGVRAAVLLAVLGGALASGGAPLRADTVALAAIAVPTYLLSTAAYIALGRGTIGLGDRTRHALRTVGVHCAALVGVARRGRRADTDRGLSALSRLGALTAAVVAFDVLLLARGVGAWTGGVLPPFPGRVGPAVVALAVLALVPMLDVLQLVVLRRQERRAYRLSADLPAVLDGAAARVRDLTPQGLRVDLPGDGPPVGDRVVVAVDAPTPSGEDVRIELAGKVRNVRALPGATALGVELEEPPAEVRERLLTLYWVTLPGLGRAWVPDPLAEAPAGSAAPVFERRRSRAGLRGATGVAVAAALTGVIPATVLASDEPRAPASAAADLGSRVRGIDPLRIAGVSQSGGRIVVRARVRVRDQALCGGVCRVRVELRPPAAGATSRALRHAARGPVARATVAVRPPSPSTVTLRLGRRSSATLVRAYGAGGRASLDAEQRLVARGGVVERVSRVRLRVPGRERGGERVAGRLGP